ncbi:MAG TPA: hypothetical protein V6D19_04245 [Stenomitos sp.]
MARFQWFKKHRVHTLAVEAQPSTTELEQPIAPTQMSEGELYSDLLEMTKFASYYPHVFPDQFLFY